MDGGDEEARRDADRLARVVVLLVAPVGEGAVDLLEEHDQPGRGLQERLPPVGAQRCQGVEPLLGHAALVGPTLLGLGGDADVPLGIGITHGHERPGLLMGAARRSRGRLDGQLDESRRDRVGAEGAHGASPVHLGVELGRARPCPPDRDGRVGRGSGDPRRQPSHRMLAAADLLRSLAAHTRAVRHLSPRACRRTIATAGPTGSAGSDALLTSGGDALTGSDSVDGHPSSACSRRSSHRRAAATGRGSATVGR